MKTLGVAWELAKNWVRRPTTPTRVVMDLTRRCNLKCEMCNTWRVEPGHELTPAEIRRVLGELPDLVWLDATGGEIFLRRDAEDVFDAIVEATPTLRVFHFPTNGWFTRRVVEACRRIRERRPELDLIVTVSIDGPRELHDAIRGVPGSFDRALETYRALDALGIETYVGTTVTPSNTEHLDALLDGLVHALPGFGPERWHWNVLQISGHFFANAHLPELPHASTRDLVKAHIRRRGIPRSPVELMELLFLVNLEFYRRGEPADIVCQALHSACFVSPEGDVHPCHVYERSLGNVRERRFEEIWASEATRRARGDIEALACGGCFTPCEAYPALAGAPLQTAAQTTRRALTLVKERVLGSAATASSPTGGDASLRPAGAARGRPLSVLR